MPAPKTTVLLPLVFFAVLPLISQSINEMFVESLSVTAPVDCPVTVLLYTTAAPVTFTLENAMRSQAEVTTKTRVLAPAASKTAFGPFPPSKVTSESPQSVIGNVSPVAAP